MKLKTLFEYATIPSREQIRAEILKIGRIGKELSIWNLKFDGFPAVYRPNLPYGIKEAENFQRAIMKKRYSEYNGTKNNIDWRYAVIRWYDIIKDLNGEFTLGLNEWGSYANL